MSVSDHQPWKDLGACVGSSPDASSQEGRVNHIIVDPFDRTAVCGVRPELGHRIPVQFAGTARWPVKRCQACWDGVGLEHMAEPGPYHIRVDDGPNLCGEAGDLYLSQLVVDYAELVGGAPWEWCPTCLERAGHTSEPAWEQLDLLDSAS